MGEVGQQTSLVALERAGGVDDRLETGVGGPEVPAPPVALGPSSALVLPEVAHALLDAHALAVFKSVSRREAKRPRWRLGRFSCAYSHSYFDPARDLFTFGHEGTVLLLAHRVDRLAQVAHEVEPVEDDLVVFIG